jgi:hypothetical protein
MFRVIQSPLSNKIFVGQVNTKTNMWKPNKSDATIDALVAVAKHVEQFGKPVIITLEDGTPEYEITVKSLKIGIKQ